MFRAEKSIKKDIFKKRMEEVEKVSAQKKYNTFKKVHCGSTGNDFTSFLCV